MLFRYERVWIYVVSFFSFAGYYAGLGLMFSLGLKEQSRFYSIPIRLVTTTIMVYLLFANFNRLKTSRNNIYFFLFFLFWSLYFIKVLWNDSLHRSEMQQNWIEYILYSLSYSILPFFVFGSLKAKDYKEVILNSLIFSGFMMGLVCTFLYWDSLINGVGRLNDQSGDTETLNPLTLSYAGALTIILASYMLIHGSHISIRRKIYLYITIVLSFIMFFLGASRGSVIAIGLTLPIMFLYLPGRTKIRIAVLTLIAAPIVVWASIATGSTVFSRTSSITTDMNAGGDESQRLVLWQKALDEFLNSPMIGSRVELKNITDYSGALYPHNLFIEVLMATGILGAFFLFPVIIKGFSNVFSAVKRDSNLVWILILLIQGLTIHFFSGSVSSAMSFFLPLGLCFSSLKERS